MSHADDSSTRSWDAIADDWVSQADSNDYRNRLLLPRMLRMAPWLACSCVGKNQGLVPERAPELTSGYSNRLPTAVAQPVPMMASLASRISMTERDANSSPFPASSNAALIFCDPRNTPLAL
jgi:hypothetical protein